MMQLLFIDFLSNCTSFETRLILACFLIIFLAILYLLFRFKDSRKIALFTIALCLIVTGILSTIFNCIYLNSSGQTLGQVLNTYVSTISKSNNIKENKWEFDDLKFLSTNNKSEYESRITYYSPLSSIDLHKNQYDIYFNDTLCVNTKQDDTYIKSEYTYSFYNQEGDEILTDTLFIDLFSYKVNYTICLSTKGGADAVKLWLFVQSRDGFAVELKQRKLIESNNFVTDESPINSKVKCTYTDGSIKYCSCYGELSELPNSYRIKYVEIPETVTRLSNELFKNCIQLESIVLPNSLKEIGFMCFFNCKSLTSIILPKGIQMIEEKAFANTGITEVYFEGCDSISDFMFDGCANLESISIGNGVTTVGNQIFKGCYSLKKISIPDTLNEAPSKYLEIDSDDSGNPVYAGITDITYNSSKDDWLIKDLDVSCLSEIFTVHCADGDLVYNDPLIPLDNYAECTFIDGNKEYISMKNIFYESLLTSRQKEDLYSVILPNSTTEIDRRAFSGCTNLAFIELSDNCKTINDEAFLNDVSLIKIDLKNVSVLGVGAFGGCTSLTEVVDFPGYACQELSGLDDLSYDGFDDNDFFGVFQGCTSLVNVSFSTNASIVPSKAFSECVSLTQINIPNSIKKIFPYAFDGCINLSNITFSDGIEVIGEYAFNNCQKLESIILPNSLKYLGVRKCYNTIIHSPVFSNSCGIKSISYLGDSSSWSELELNFDDSNLVQNVVIHCIDQDVVYKPIYITLTYVDGSNETIAISSRGYDFSLLNQDEKNNLSKIYISYGATQISTESCGASGLKDCPNLVRVYLPASLNFIELSFSNCPKVVVECNFSCEYFLSLNGSYIKGAKNIYYNY